MKRTLLILIFYITNNIFSQLAGESTYQFLNISSSPRQLALGGKIITNFDYDVSQALYNPSVINSEMDNNLSLNFLNSSRNPCPSFVHPGVLALGKNQRTTLCPLKSDNDTEFSSPSNNVKSGALSPIFNIHFLLILQFLTISFGHHWIKSSH